MRKRLSLFAFLALLAPVFAEEPRQALLPLDRSAYFIGEIVPLALIGEGELKLDAINSDGRATLYTGQAGPLLLNTFHLSPGDYAIELNGTRVVERFTLTSTLRKSAGSMQDEWGPANLSSDEVARTMRESGLTACVTTAAADMGRADWLDAMARTGALLMVNPDTRPTSFFPVGNNPEELDGMSQRMILTAQANGRYPNFGGFLYGWDTTGYAVNSRRGLQAYWGWGDQTQALRNYIERMDKQKMDEFTRRTGFKPVTEEEYLSYMLSIGRPEFGAAIDLPTKGWLEEIARYAKPMPESERIAFEQRFDAWSSYLMGLYQEAYSTFTTNLREVDPSLRNSASVQSDHAPVRNGQHFPSAHAPLDFQYQSTWNDQVGGPDYLYQWLLVDALLEMERGNKPTWISNALGTAHGRASIPGKFTRVAAHGLAFGSSGIGFALEGFSNIFGGMNPATNWQNMKGKAGEADLLAGRDFLDRFATLAVEARGDHGVGILWSKTQYARQHITMGFGKASYQALVALTRLGYTPRFVTEDEIATGRAGDVAALVVLGQTFALPEKVVAGLGAFAKNGGRILMDGSTTVPIVGAEKLPLTFSFTTPGKPHNWEALNMIGIENDVVLYERSHPALAKAFVTALGETGHAWLTSERGADTKISLLQIDGGRDAAYVVAVNDSFIATQADWHQVKEQIAPTQGFPVGGMIYDCTDEKSLGKAAPFGCDLSMTTARVFAILPRELKVIGLSASQSINAGEDLLIKVEFSDTAGKQLAAVLPFQLSVIRPDGQRHAEFYRSTTADGTFSIAVPLPANVPVGQWSVRIRSQLTGDVAMLPLEVTPANVATFATALTDSVIVRDRTNVEKMLAQGASVVLPVFDVRLLPAAEQVKATLAARGVTVDIRQNPTTNTYTIAFDPTDAQKQENARADRGEAIGQIKRESLNGNDWASNLSGWRFGKTVILLDLVEEKGTNPMAESLTKAGLLWPQVSGSFPGKGRAVVQAIPWAFAPRTTTLVIQAADMAGLIAGAQALANLPADRLTPGITAAKAALWQQYHIGGKPALPASDGLTANGLTTSLAPQPFAMAFPTDRPLAADQVKHPEPSPNPAYPVPGIFAPKQFVLCYLVDDQFIETATVEPLMPDMRFSQAIKLVAEVKTAGKTNVSATGVFRYSDRKPCWQAQWEDILSLHDRIVPHERRPLEFEVQIAGKTVGKLVPSRTEEKEVPLELASPTAGLKPRSVVEEVVTQLTGEFELQAGRQEILLIPKNVVDGRLDQVTVGQ